MSTKSELAAMISIRAPGVVAGGFPRFHAATPSIRALPGCLSWAAALRSLRRSPSAPSVSPVNCGSRPAALRIFGRGLE